MMALEKKQRLVFASILLVAGLAGCTSGSDDSTTVEGDVSIAYVRRPTSTLGNPTDSVVTGQGGDLYVCQKSSPTSCDDAENITRPYTNGQGDVSDPEVSYDGKRILFSMRRPSDTHWGIWEYDTTTRAMNRIACDATDTGDVVAPGDDVDPAYLPDDRIVFASNRQGGSRRLMQAQGITPYTYVDEYEREAVTALHVMDNPKEPSLKGKKCKQISFNQSHDRNPVVLRTGEIMFSRWDHVGERNQFTIFKVNPDGTNLFVVYGAHSPGNSYLHPREMPDGRLISTTMPLSGTREGGSLEIIDANNYSDNDAPGTSNPPANQLGEQAGQFQVTRLLFPDRSSADHQAMRGMGVSPLGRYSSPYPLWDGTNRVLVVFTPSQPTPGTDALGRPVTVEGAPRYGIYMLNPGNGTLRPIVLPRVGYYYSDPLPLQSRTPPQARPDVQPDPAVDTAFGQLTVNTVYDTDRLERMGNAVLASGESIPRTTSGAPDIVNLKLPGTAAFNSRVARFFRITKAVPTPRGLSRGAIGETENEMQQIVGYGVIEPDGSIRARVPSDTPIGITALDSEGRAFTPHTHWIQARGGERRFCKGCHSSRLGTTSSTNSLLNSAVGGHPSPANLNQIVDTATMAETRMDSTLNPNAASYGHLKLDIGEPDFWTALYNASPLNGGSILPIPSVTPITYSGLTVSPVRARNGATCNSTTWSATNCAIVINFPDHIQPILNSCATSGCHSGSAPAAGLDLVSTLAGEFARTTAYQELLVGDPRLEGNPPLPVITIDPEDGEVEIEREPAPVMPETARGSRLIERIFEQPLKAAAVGTSTRAFCRAGGTSCVNGATWVNHSGFLNASQRRVLVEWVDVGAQYYNDPFDSNGNVRSAAGRLSESVFTCRVQPILQANCASCHQPFGGGGTPNPNFVNNRFILTGNAESDFSVTASMVTNVTAPDSSLLLYRPSRAVSDTPSHPGTTAALPSGSANYDTIRTWIAGTLTCP